MGGGCMLGPQLDNVSCNIPYRGELSQVGNQILESYSTKLFLSFSIPSRFRRPSHKIHTKYTCCSITPVLNRVGGTCFTRSTRGEDPGPNERYTNHVQNLRTALGIGDR